jgi:hypothetical protein
MMKAVKLILLLCLLGFKAHTQTAPTLYYTFDASNALAPSVGTGNLSIAGIYAVNNGGQVSKYLSTTYAGTNAITGGTFTASGAVTIQFLFKPGYKFDFSRDPQVFNWGNVTIAWNYPELWFITSTAKSSGGTVSHNQKIYFDGINAKSWTYHQDGDWHLYSFVFNPTTGVKQIYVDGLLSSGFSVSGLDVGTINGSTGPIRMNPSGTSYQKVEANYDEIALYPAALTAAQIYQNYLDVVAGLHYSNALAGSVPAASAVTAGMEVDEFAPGYVQNSGSANAIQRTALVQLQNTPLPRYNPNVSTLRHMNWMQLNYFGGYKQYTDVQARDTSTEINKEMAYNWNYMILISDHVSSNKNSYANTNHWSNKWIQLANANPTIPASAITFWAQFRPSFCGVPSDTQYISKKALPASYYLRNASNQFLNLSGSTVVTDGGSKVISPAAPLDSLRRDGEAMNCYINFLETYLTRPINFISENNEIMPYWNVMGYPNDPTVNAQRTASGLSWDEYMTTRKRVISNEYRNQFLSGLQSAAAAAGQEFQYSEYAVYGFDANDNTSDVSRWKGERLIQTPVNGRYMQTIDYYPRKPEQWYGVSGAFKGWTQITQSVYGSIANQDSFMAPFTNAGWSTNPEADMRPSQFLGNMKLLCALGALRFQAGYFNLDINNVANPKGYAYQVMAPSYAQAVFSRVPYWENSTLLNGDWVWRPEKIGVYPGFQYYAGNRHKVVVVRQNKANTNQYVISAALQRLTNMTGENTPNQTASIQLAGTTVTFPISEQGNVYLWDKTDSTFIQLDSWHEASDPNRWSNDFTFQAEVYDEGFFPVKTYGKTGYDYTSAYSVVSYADTATVFDTLKYTFEPRSNATYYVWVKARSKDGTSGNVIVRMNNLTQDTTDAITSTSWYWYRYKLTGTDTIKYSLTGDIDNTLKIRVNNKKIEIDQIVLTTDKNLTFPEVSVPCGLSANVTASGPTSFCAGGNVTLTATASSSYSWSTGATTQSIVVTSAGSYSVTIYDNTGCSGSSAAVVVTVNAAPSIPSITVTGSVCAGDSLQLQSAAATSYLWNTGATTQSIYVKTDGLYRVTILNASGCPNGNDYTADFNPPLVLNVSQLTPLAGCINDTVSLRLNNAYTYANYHWYSYPDTATVISTDSIIRYKVYVNDTIRLFAEDGDGCTALSPQYVIVRNICDTCNSVNNLRVTEVLTTSARIAWSPQTTAYRFVVYLTNRRTNAVITSTIEGARRNVIFTGLTANTGYRYYVQTICNDGSTYNSQTKSFTTKR